MEENKTNKINFFKKVGYSITKFEKYPNMAAEGTNRAIKYLMIVVAIVTIFLTIGSIKEMYSLVQNLASYIESNMPEISYKNGELIVETDVPIIISDIQYNGIDKIVIDSSTETKEQKDKLKNENDIIGTSIYFFRDEIILKTKTQDNQEIEKPYTYNEFLASYTQKEISEFNKTELVEYMRSSEMNFYYIRYAASLFVYLLIIEILVALLDAVELAILGWVTSFVAKVKLKISALYNMAIYALTLPMILNIIYIVINYFTEFTIGYFQVAYIAIAYIYLAAAIFILKDDFIKKQTEVAKIIEEQKKVREEILEKEDKQKEDEEEKNEKENKNDEEPKGSEA